ncbi:unnamed protein product [Cunninghamella blakesleeana]
MADPTVEDNQQQQQQIKEEYELWKKTTPMLYDIVVTRSLTWPTLTCQWLPNATKENDNITQDLLIGTHTNDEEDNYLQILTLNLPQNNNDEPTNTQGKVPNIELSQKLSHPGEVNRARFQYEHPNIIATKTRDGPVLIYDRTKSLENPILRLTGHTKEGYGLEWNHHNVNHLISAGYDNIVCHWDIESTPDSNDKTLEPYQRYEGHTDCVGDVSWNGVQDTVFASVGDDMKLIIWDSRTGTKPIKKIQAHNAEINSVAFHPRKEWMIATGSSDKTIGLFDIRKIDTKLYSFDMHDGEIHQVSWSPHEDPILASASTDRKIMIWDLSKIGEEQTPEDAEDGPPELMFIHNGHTSRISEFNWNPIEPWMIASAADDNIVQVWQVSKKVYTNKDNIEIALSDLE